MNLPTQEKAPWHLRLLVMFIISLIVSLGYVAINRLVAMQIANGRTVLTYAFDWEHNLPRLAWAYIPYLSALTLFQLSFLACRSRARLMVHAKRVLLVSLVAFICFLIWPMTPCWPRETITEWPANLQWLAQLLVWLDPPFNQCPSLHVAHGTLCLVVFVRMLPRWLGIVCVAWYALVFVSVVLTHQHHVVDVISGGALAGLALALLKERPVTHAA